MMAELIMENQDKIQTNEIYHDEIRNQEKIRTKHILYHCRTKCNMKTTSFIWSIANFWDVCNFLDTLTSSNVETLPFKLQMRIDKEKTKLSFFIYPINNKSEINIQRYDICIQGSQGPVMITNWKIFCSNTDSLYDVCLETLRLHKSIYFNDHTLSVYFVFESCDNILHSITSETILDMQSLAITNNSPCDDRYNSLVTFVMNGRNFYVKRSLLVGANSTVFNDLLKKNDTEEKAENIIILEPDIYKVTYSSFELLIFYLQSGGHVDFKLNEELNIENYTNTLHELLVAANVFDIKVLKLLCEKHLIEFTTKDNAVETLNAAITNNAVYLGNFAKRVIKLHLDDIINTTTFAELIKNKPEMLCEILKQDLLEEDVSYFKNKNNDNNCNK